jgi:hypothetical protein
MGKNFKKKYHNKPSNESISAFKQIEKFIQEEKNKERDKFSFQQKKVKMPYKMYMGIKNSVLKKYKKEMEFNKNNDIIASSDKNQKFMTKYVLDKYNKKQEEKRKQKLQISRNNKTSQLKNGVLTLSKNWKNNLK